MLRTRLIRVVITLSAIVALSSCGGDGGGSPSPLTVTDLSFYPGRAYVGYGNDGPVDLNGTLAVAGGTATSLRISLVNASGGVAGDYSSPVTQVSNPTNRVGFEITLKTQGLPAGTYTVQVAASNGSNGFSPALAKPFVVVAQPYVSLPPMPTPRAAFVVAAVGTRIYVLTGALGTSEGGVASSVVEVFDTATNAWVGAPGAPNARIGAAAAVVGSKIFVFGGYTAARPTGIAPVDVFDTATGLWTTTTSWPAARFFAGATTLGTDVYLIGGTRDPADVAASKTVERYDTTTGVWTPVADLPYPVSHPVAFTANGGVYEAGGTVLFGSATSLITGAIYGFDATTGGWTIAGPNMVQPRSRFAAVFTGNLLRAFGGTTVTAGANAVQVATATSEADVLKSPAFTATAPLPQALSGIVGTVVGTDVYLIGTGVTYRYPPAVDTP